MQSPFDTGSEPRLVYEDASVIVVCKPCRLHTAPLAAVEDPSLCDWVFDRYPDAAFDASGLRGQPASVRGEGGLFHRLDYETSGLVLFARTPAALAWLLSEQEAGRVVKRYAALAAPSLALQPGARPGRGRPAEVEPEAWDAAIEAAASEPVGLPSSKDTDKRLAELARLALGREGRGGRIDSRFRPFGPGGQRVACIALGEEDGKKRRGSPERAYSSELCALRASDQVSGALSVELALGRGFRHQVRAQLAWLGLPILGDPLYGGLLADRLCLHAASITFAHPESSHIVAFSS
jgi:23S rRNA-/tRNA-specific pseudouridylate synthase